MKQGFRGPIVCAVNMVFILFLETDLIPISRLHVSTHAPLCHLFRAGRTLSFSRSPSRFASFGTNYPNLASFASHLRILLLSNLSDPQAFYLIRSKLIYLTRKQR